MARTPLNENCSAVILNKLPKKLGDPGRFLIPCEFSGINTCNALADLGASINLMPYSVWKDLSLPELTPTCMTLELADRSITEPIGIAKDVRLMVGKFQSFKREGEITLRVGKEAITFNLDQTLRYTANYNHMTANRIDVIELACEEYSQEVLDDEPISQEIDATYYIGAREELKVVEAKTVKSSIDEPPEVELKDLPPHLEYAFLEGDDKLPVIIAKDLKDEEKAALIKSQRRVNPKIHDVIKKEVEKLLDAGLIYPISDSPWVSPIHCVPKKGGITVVKNDDNDLIPTRLVTGWRVCIDYRKLNEATRKDHFPLPFMDQMLERLAGNQYYCFLDGFSGYFQIPIDPKDQEKTTFTCPYGTFAYRRMPFGRTRHVSTMYDGNLP
ncbi:reverse transcriptase domain-containing protein [Tanacetum coccineum]